MATKHEPEFPTSPANDESDDEKSVGSTEQQEEEGSASEEEEEPEEDKSNVARILKQLQSSGAIIRKPKQQFPCKTCSKDFADWEELENHLIQHVSSPRVLIKKLPSDDESEPDFEPGDEPWSDEEEKSKTVPPPTPQKLDISQILKKTGISIKKPGENKPVADSPDSALSKLSGLGFTIKKNPTTPQKDSNGESKENTNEDLMQKLGKLGGIKLKLKSDGNSNNYKVINGLKDFKASDDEEEDWNSADEEDGDPDKSGDERVSPPGSPKNSESDNPSTPESSPPKVPESKRRPSQTKVEPPENSVLKSQLLKLPPDQIKDIKTSSPPRLTAKEPVDTNTMNNVLVKKELESDPGPLNSTAPLFPGQVKTERSSPGLNDATTPTITKVKTETEAPFTSNTQPLFAGFPNPPATVTELPTTPLLPVTKKESEGVTIIEINGDSNDEDDDCCVVSATPAPDIKPNIVPKTENPVYPPTSAPAYPTSTAAYPTTTQSNVILSSRLISTAPPSTEKQHNFNWNAPDTKPSLDLLEKSADDIFESLLASSNTKKESNLSMGTDASEYISLDRLGPQHTCDVCNIRFTDVILLESHQRATGHSKSLVAPSVSNMLMPAYSSSNSLISSLFPVKQLAEQVGKLSTVSTVNSSGGPFTHQQNVLINIQAYPGQMTGGMMVPPQGYNSYGAAPNMSNTGYQSTSPNSMYRGQATSQPGGQPYPGQYPQQGGYGQSYPQPPMSQAGYPGIVTQSGYTMPGNAPYSTASPLQSMQQAVYGQAGGPLGSPQGMGQLGGQLGHMGQMGPPSQMPSPGQGYAPASSPNSMKPPAPPGNIRIQNVQTFGPGQMGSPGQMPSPGQLRPPAPGVRAPVPRARMPGVRPGARPSIRPGIQVHGQAVRGAKPGGPRMPMKRPGGASPGAPGQKRRLDMLLPGKHDNEDCTVMALQKQREGLPMIHSVQGSKDKLNLGSQISIQKKTVNKEASAMANVLASRGIMVKQKAKSRSPSPERPLPHIPNLGAGVSIKHSSRQSEFSIPEAKVGGGMLSCRICNKMFMNQNSLSVHMNNAHPQSKVPVFKCEECPASYPKSLQLQHHRRVFHNVSGPNRELGLPVVDLSQEDNLKRLSDLGIYSFIPLANREQGSGCFGIPVISVHNVQNGMTNSLQALGADGLLSLGPLKPLPNS